MRSRTSFCNGPLLRKNMARFAPLWLLYTLALLLGMALMYSETDSYFWFASNMGELIPMGSLINLFYAPTVAMLLFGDLYNGRMCNGLHAMPLKRKTIFGTDLVSGLLFSMVPTGIFCAASVPLLMNTCIVDAWMIAPWVFLGMNLSFLCFFGIAVFSAMCVGNRFAMIAIYALLNGGAFMTYFLVDTIYTPMLYGVVTSSSLLEMLTPVAQLMEAACLEVESYFGVLSRFSGRESEMQAAWFMHPEGWMTQGIWAAIGAGFLLLGWLLYRKRKLECAGDTMATKALEPVFQIAVSVCGAAGFSFFTTIFLGTLEGTIQYLFLGAGLVVGWFGGRMLLERTVRVFRWKNFLGFALLTAALAGTLAMTHYDVLGIETWVPEVEDVKSVTFGYSSYRGMSEELTEDADIAEVIRLQELALEERLETFGAHVILDGQRVFGGYLDKDARMDKDYVYSATIYIDYTLESGREVSREYIIWGDGETGEIVNEYLSRWEIVRNGSYFEETEVAAIDSLENSGYTRLYIMGREIPMEHEGKEAIESLLEAIRADCEDRTMTQRETFHTGHFRMVNEVGETEYFRSFWVQFVTASGKSGEFYVFADSENTLKWLMERDLIDFAVHSENGYAG